LAKSRESQTDQPSKYPRKVGDLKALQRMLWWAVLRLRRILETTDNLELGIRAIYCLSTTAGAFVKCTEVGELQQRLSAIEALISRRNGHGRRSDG
jgi:hypothetical protein